MKPRACFPVCRGRTRPVYAAIFFFYSTDRQIITSAETLLPNPQIALVLDSELLFVACLFFLSRTY